MTTECHHYTPCLKTNIAAVILLCTQLASADVHKILGSDGDDRLVGTPGPDYFIGGPGADVFVINHLSTIPDQIEDFDSDQGDMIELTFNNEMNIPFRQDYFSISPKGVVKFKVENKQQDVVLLNQTNLSLELDHRKGRYFLKFSKKI